MPQINQTRYDIPANPDWARMLGGVIQGGAGQITMNQAQQQKQQEDNQKYMAQLAVALAQQNRLQPGNQIHVGGAGWNVTDTPQTPENLKTSLEAQKLQWEMDHPDEAMYRKAGAQGLSDAILAASSGVLKDADNRPVTPAEALLNARQAIETMRTGMGPVEPGRPGSPGLLGWRAKAAVPESRVMLTKDGIIRIFKQPDGTWAQPQAVQPQSSKKKGIIDKKTANEYLKKSGGDMEKAKAMAVADGWQL